MSIANQFVQSAVAGAILSHIFTSAAPEVASNCEYRRSGAENCAGHRVDVAKVRWNGKLA